MHKVTVEEEMVLIEPIKGTHSEKYQKIRKMLCEDLDLDGLACDEVRARYNEFYNVNED